LEWEGKPNAEVVKNPSSHTVKAIRHISLFDSREHRLAHLIFRFSEFHYAQRGSSAVQDPAALPFFSLHCICTLLFFRCGALPSAEPHQLELEIAVQMPVQGQTIHQLAAGKVLLELKHGMSCVRSVVGDIDEERRSGLLGEGVRVGLKYGLRVSGRVLWLAELSFSSASQGSSHHRR